MYDDGRIYSHHRNKFLKGEITKRGYLSYTLSTPEVKSKKYRIHRLVAYLFIGAPEDDALVVNHKDGNKLNNHYSNLEWCSVAHNNYHARVNKLNNISSSNSKRWENDVFRKNTAKHISEGLIRNGSNKGKRNPKFRYEIYDENGKEYTRRSLSRLLHLSQSFTDRLIHDAANGRANKHFEKHKIHIKDIKNKVNRLSNASNNEKDVAHDASRVLVE